MEITTLTQREPFEPFEYMCTEDDWGTLTLRSVIEDVETSLKQTWDKYGMARPEARALIACSLDCGKNLVGIARIQQKHDYVLLASHDRLLPDGEFCDIPEK